VLEAVTGWSIGEKDTSDDRLARVVEELGLQPLACNQIEEKNCFAQLQLMKTILAQRYHYAKDRRGDRYCNSELYFI
jgi:hypothetical protein